MHPFGSNNHTSIAINEHAPLLHHERYRQSMSEIGQLILIEFGIVAIGTVIGMVGELYSLIEYILYATAMMVLILLYIILSYSRPAGEPLYP
jgi:hypothetical protein